ncbi:hypothetical protein STRDD11_01492 [Streptococcus sp. DD11]|nr:hypothetical protein STRDD11_01492 [Streptococcus sp. DD11]
MLLDNTGKMGNEIRIRQDNGFAKHGSALGASDIKSCAELSQVSQTDIICGSSQSIGQSGPVHIERDAVAAADLGDDLQLGFRIESAQFGRLGKVDHARHDHVFVVAVVPVVCQRLFNLLGSQFAVLAGDFQDLMAAKLNGPGFMDTDMAALGGDDALVGAEQRCDDDLIGLGAPDQKPNLRLRTLAGFPDSSFGRGGELIAAVAAGLHHIGFCQFFHNARMSSL